MTSAFNDTGSLHLIPVMGLTSSPVYPLYNLLDDLCVVPEIRSFYYNVYFSILLEKKSCSSEELVAKKKKINRRRGTAEQKGSTS